MAGRNKGERFVSLLVGVTRWNGWICIGCFVLLSASSQLLGNDDRHPEGYVTITQNAVSDSGSDVVGDLTFTGRRSLNGSFGFAGHISGSNAAGDNEGNYSANGLRDKQPATINGQYSGYVPGTTVTFELLFQSPFEGQTKTVYFNDFYGTYATSWTVTWSASPPIGDNDGDGIPDDQDPDDDNDGTPDDRDSEPTNPNIGGDDDGDGTPNLADTDPNDPNVGGDADGDGTPDHADPAPNDPDVGGGDSDGDGTPDADDTSPYDPNHGGAGDPGDGGTDDPNVGGGGYNPSGGGSDTPSYINGDEMVERTAPYDLGNPSLPQFNPIVAGQFVEPSYSAVIYKFAAVRTKFINKFLPGDYEDSNSQSRNWYLDLPLVGRTQIPVRPQDLPESVRPAAWQMVSWMRVLVLAGIGWMATVKIFNLGRDVA